MSNVKDAENKNHCQNHSCLPESPYVKDFDFSKNFVKCDHCRISIIITQSVVCSDCSRRFCLPHRHQKDHNCLSLQTKSYTDLINRTDKTVHEQILAKLGSNCKSGVLLKNRGTKNNALATKVLLMKLKSRASGDEAIPIEERLYFNLKFIQNELSSNQKGKYFDEVPIFLCKEWSIGKCVDWIAKKFSLINRNNEPDKPKLILMNDDTRIDLASHNCCTSTERDYFCFKHILKDLLEAEILENACTLKIKYV
ncbi:ATP synthase subunit gamma [Sarcoptes scabiei]|nr:ATP synthase subunit gamma [Sarcoptes scabiei]